MRRLLSSHLCLVALTLLLTLTTAVQSDIVQGLDGRQLKQAKERQPIIVSEKNAKLDGVVKDAKEGDTLLITAPSVTLDQLLKISVAKLHIKGASKKKPAVVQCSSESARMDVLVDGVIFENLVIRDCSGPAVRISNENVEEYDPLSEQESKPKEIKSIGISFKNVRFLNNRDVDDSFSYHQTLDGGAIQVTRATEAKVEDCVFEGNVAFLGGAIRVDSGSLEVKRSKFLKNKSQISGGAISGSFGTAGQESTTTFVVEDSIFERNEDILGGEDSTGLTLTNGAPLETSEFLSFPSPQSSGGAIFVEGFTRVSIKGCIFDGNKANPAAGAIFISDNGLVELTNNTLRNNVAQYHGNRRNFDLEQGGAIYVAFTDAKSKIKLVKNIFENNTATYGGGLHMVMMLVTSASMEECEFIGNTAHLGGGGLVLRNTIEVEILDSKFIRNRATAGGGALFTNGAGARFTQGADSSRDSRFEENLALDGGACFFLGAGQVSSQKLAFIRNKAQRNGGGMCLVESLASGSVGLQESLFLENAARRGGGLFMDSIASLILRAPHQHVSTQFIGNKAMAGGAVYLRPSSQVKNVVSAALVNCTGNKAVKRMEEIYSEPVHYADIDVISAEASSRGRRLMQGYFQDKADGTDVLLRTTGEDPCSPGGGGAICLVLSEVPERASVKVEIMNSYIAENTAATGGGFFIATRKRSTWSNECHLSGTTSESLTNSPCRQLSIRDVEMEKNRASDAGGAIFASDAYQVHYSTQKDALKDFDFKRLSNMKAGAKNDVDQGGYGGEYASNAVRLAIISPKAKGEGHPVIADHASGTALPPIKLKVVDAFQSVVSSGISDSQIKVTVSSLQGIVSGQLVATAEAGVVVFDSLVVTAHPGTYTLIFQAEEDVMESYLVSLSIRHCNVGEHNITEGKICSVCQPGFYGFDPAIPCQACEANANCSGGASQVPRDGYWHSTPFSTQFHECLVRRACSYDGREEALTLFTLDEKITPGTTVYSNDDYPQCRKGYTDVLCGSCESNYGSKPGGECIQCRGRAATYSIVTIVALWQLVLLAFTIRSALNSIRDMKDMRVIVAQNGGTLCSLPSTYQIKLASTPSSSSLGESSKKLSLNAESVFAGTSDKSLNVSGTPSSKSLTPIDHIIAAETVSETIKIAVNFLQVTSVAVSINVEWTETVKRMLETENSAAGFSNGSAFAPLTCLLENSEHRSIHGMVLRVAFPVVLMIFVIFLFFLNWLRIRVTQNKGLEYLHSRSVICILVALFFSYESINRELMRTVNCVQLDEDVVEDETGYNVYAAARGQYWGEDTSFKCFKEDHLRLVAILGIPGLTLFSFGIPAFLLIFLLYNREHKRINSQQFLNTYGFVYQNYTERFVYWEVSIMLRKACIGGIVVFAYPLGANLQGIMALGVLIVALVLHLVATPFKYTILNVLESFSLLVSIFTFYSGIVFNDSNTSYPAKVLLSSLLILINVSLFLMFVVRVLMDVDKFITAKLILLGETELPNGCVGRSMKLASMMVELAKEQVQITIQSQASRFSRRTKSHRRSPSKHLTEIQEGDIESVAPESSQQTEK